MPHNISTKKAIKATLGLITGKVAATGIRSNCSQLIIVLFWFWYFSLFELQLWTLDYFPRQRLRGRFSSKYVCLWCNYEVKTEDIRYLLRSDLCKFNLWVFPSYVWRVLSLIMAIEWITSLAVFFVFPSIVLFSLFNSSLTTGSKNFQRNDHRERRGKNVKRASWLFFICMPCCEETYGGHMLIMESKNPITIS